VISIDVSKSLFGNGGELKLKVKLEIGRGEFIALMGESGSGKTSFLRILAGLESCIGDIKVDDEVWLNRNLNLPPQKREVGFVFQEYALFENMSVIENLLFVSKDIELAEYLLKIIELKELRDRYPESLSGGQKQRVAIARAIMKKPKLLLMDEPLSALDSSMRLRLQKEIKLLHQKFNMTTIMVSHDLSEVYRLADRVLVLKDGGIVTNKGVDLAMDLSSPPELKAQVVDIDDGFLILSICGTLTKIKDKNYSDCGIGDIIKISISIIDTLPHK